MHQTSPKEPVEIGCSPFKFIILEFGDDVEGLRQLFQGHQTLQIYYTYNITDYVQYVNIYSEVEKLIGTYNLDALRISRNYACRTIRRGWQSREENMAKQEMLGSGLRYPAVDGGSLGDDYHRIVDWNIVRKDCMHFGERLCKAAPQVIVYGAVLILIFAAAQAMVPVIVPQ